MLRRSRSSCRRGAILPLVVICLIALFGMVALAIDIGVIALARNQCQNGRCGAAKVVIFETDGVPNTECTSSFVNGGEYNSMYTGLTVGSNIGNNNATVVTNALAAVDRLVALDTANPPGYSSGKIPARVHTIGFGHLLQSGSTAEANARAFLLNVQKRGNTSPTNATVIESYKIITGDYNTRIDNLRQALERIMQSGVQLSLIR